jgi:para-nitrobenzyl esterase
LKETLRIAAHGRSALDAPTTNAALVRHQNRNRIRPGVHSTASQAHADEHLFDGSGADEQGLPDMISTPELRERKFGETPAEAGGLAIAAKLHAPNIAALRAMDAATLNNAAPASGFAAFGAVDGHILPRQLVDVFDRHEQAPVPVLAGFNSGEVRSLPILMPPAPASSADYENAIRTRFGGLADTFLKRCPASDVHESMLTTVRDAFYGWSIQRLVRAQAALGVPAYLYYFDHGYPSEDAAGLHAFRASEIPYVFGRIDRTLPFWPKIPATSVEQKLADAMGEY